MYVDRKARLVTREHGYVLRKSRRPISHQNAGGYMIVDPATNFPVAGFTYDLDAGAVLGFFTDRPRADA